MKNNFVHLHVHSTYSFTDGFGTPDQYVNRAVEIGQPALGVTDHGNISVHYKWYKHCLKSGIKPILGCEMYIVETNEDIREREYNHITVLVQNNAGYRNLTKLVTKAWNENFYYKPRITYQDLFDHQEGLIVLSGCLSSPIMEALREGNIPKAVQDVFLFKNNIKNFYIELQAIDFPEGKKAYQRLMNLLDKDFKGIPCVVTGDCHYVREEDSKTQEVLLCVQTKDTMKNPDHWHFDQDDFFLKSREQMELSMRRCFPKYDPTDALDNTVKIAEMVDFEFPKATPIKFPIPDNEKMKFLADKCVERLKKLKKYEDQTYVDRLNYELDLVDKKGFQDYFLVIYDLVNWAKENGILVGPARGSAAGSLACYLLRITEVDPIPYGLIFERFIDINRADLPDIDIDFEDVRRHEVKEYLAEKYGSDKVGNLPTFAEFKGKSAIDDVGRVFGIPFKVCDEVKSAIIERSGGDSRAGFTLEDTFSSDVFTKPKEHLKTHPELKYAIKLEGQLRQMGQHAAGVVVSNEPLTNFCAIYMVKGEQVISLSYKDITDIGLLKIDILGLSTLSVVSRTIKQIEERHGKKIDIYKLPLDDKKTYDGFVKEKMFGVFQFDGQAVNQVSRQIKPKDFESMSAISALARPGPLNSGNTTEYIMRRSGKSPVKYVHPIMKNITGDSYGIVIYQEQVMRIMREIGDMSWEDTSAIRKNMSRSLGVEAFNAFQSKFMPGAIGHGLTEKIANKIWEEMCHYGSWSFNKSHSVSYGMISYWTMWLKIHYPMEFYSSILFLTEMEAKKKKILKEYKREGHKVLSVHINRSKEHFSIDDDGLRIGFADIKGIGPMTAEKYLRNSPYVSYYDFAKKNYKNRIEPNKYTQTLIDLGAFDSIESSSLQVNLFGEKIPEYIKTKLTFSERFSLCPWDMEFGIETTWKQFIIDNKKIFKTEIMPIERLNEVEKGFKADDIVIYGIVYDRNLRDVREVSASKGKTIDLSKYNGQYQFANFVVEDDTDFITVRLSNRTFPTYGNLIFERCRADDVVIIKGKMGSGIRMFFANQIGILREIKEKVDAQSIHSRIKISV